MILQQQTTADRKHMLDKARRFNMGLPIINEPATDPDEGKFTAQAETIIDDYYTEEFIAGDVLEDAVSTFVMLSIWLRDKRVAPTMKELNEPEAACRQICEHSLTRKPL